MSTLLFWLILGNLHFTYASDSIENDNNVLWWLVGTICGVIFFLWLIVIAFVCWKKRAFPVLKQDYTKHTHQHTKSQTRAVVSEQHIVIQEPLPARLKGTSGMSRKEYLSRH